MKKDIIESYNRISPYIHKTPVITSTTINKITGGSLYFKCENFQKMGAFKMRGATNAILQLSSEQKQKGVVTHSSGNFAQALALAAKNLGVKSYIVMPSNAPDVKKSAVRGYGGEITECEPTLEARESTAKKIQLEKGATFVHPFNDFNVILGNASAGKELLEKHSDLDFIISPVGGGGLISGIALSALAFSNNCKVIGAEPFAVDDAYRSIESGKIEHNLTIDTIADGLKTSLGDITYNIINNHVEKIIRTTEEEIIAAMKLIWERMKIIIEPSSAVALAAILNSKTEFKNKKVGVILSGGNVDFKNLPFS
ncbi:pyridoxal-phosphate dependent enzyme [Aureibaculum marinum]|uniref:Pyridoxal-phosphate dependent enzyme n=1 Tax=Aureibaculum marinum TaxID=2487930 RepID=A0A3N4NWP8_9FLAO|nr:pyridoxal-phosphate dependent enzyme [Aureibaculum marinum]